MHSIFHNINMYFFNHSALSHETAACFKFHRLHFNFLAQCIAAVKCVSIKIKGKLTLL